MKRLANYITEARAELAKVNWPTRQEAIQLTITVIVFSAVVAAFIGLLDNLFSAGLQKLILKG